MTPMWASNWKAMGEETASGKRQDLGAMLKGTGMTKVARIDTGLCFEPGFIEKVDSFAREFGLQRIELPGGTAAAKAATREQRAACWQIRLAGRHFQRGICLFNLDGLRNRFSLSAEKPGRESPDYQANKKNDAVLISHVSQPPVSPHMLPGPVLCRVLIPSAVDGAVLTSEKAFGPLPPGRPLCICRRERCPSGASSALWAAQLFLSVRPWGVLVQRLRRAHLNATHAAIAQLPLLEWDQGEARRR